MNDPDTSDKPRSASRSQSGADAVDAYRRLRERYTQSRARSLARARSNQSYRHRAARGAPATLQTFLSTSIRTRSGPFSFEGHAALEPLCAALADPSIARIDVLKATQIGMTTLAGFGYGLWELTEHDRNVGYFLPTNRMAEELLGDRLAHAAAGDMAHEVQSVRSDGIVRAGSARLYVRGLHSMLGAISIPLDVNLYDEVDDLNREHLLWARQRLDGSPYAREVAFACGRYPGEGIDARFQHGTQHHRHLRCPGCGKDDQIPELLFPENVQRVDDTWRVVCTRCGHSLDVERDGRWVAHYPGREAVSYRISALSIPWVRLDRLMREWDAAQQERRLLAPFRCSKLALPDAADRQVLTADDIARCTVAFAVPPAADARLYVGIDTGDVCHIAATVVEDTDKLYYVMFDSMPGERLVERLRSLAGTYTVAGVLIDQRPEGALARAVCRTFPGVAYLQQFTQDERVKSKLFGNETFRILAFDREDTLGEWCDLVRRGTTHVRFPQETGGSTFVDSEVARHILAGAQRTETIDGNGQTVSRFRGGAVENHYLMAAVFAWRITAHVHGRHVGPRDVGLIGKRATKGL